MRQLTKDESEMLLNCIVIEQQKIKKPDELPWSFLAQVVQKRMEVMNLPIKFTDPALLSVDAFCTNPGRAVLFLIDCLSKFEGQTVTVDMICKEVYPFGVYTDEEFKKIVDEQLKTRKMKWSEIY